MKAKVFITLTSFLISTAGCTTTTPIVDLQKAPKDQPIEVLTKGGAQHRFDKWRLDERQSIVGFVKTAHISGLERWDMHTIPADSVQSVALVHRTMETTMQTTLVVIAAAAGAMLLYIAIRALSVLAGFRSQ